jgi:enoyl-CoA hydratase
MQETAIVLTRREGRVGIIQLNRPSQLNALNDQLMDVLGEALRRLDGDPGIGCIILTGGEKVFAAGGDVGALADNTFTEATRTNLITRNWETLLEVRKPVIAAVAGVAFGGGCELAMMCDFIIAAESAKFAQPEIKLGIIPGAGGTQRLPRAVSKSKAMEMVLTGSVMTAEQAEHAGLVARVVPELALMEEALKTASIIAGLSLPSVILAKAAVNRAYESPLSEGVKYERLAFHSLFGTRDQKEGMAAFLQKRKPEFRHG